ncbi:hypothetical protein ILUMI_00322 [Ignelater luminosus]|uniref:PiggyBac transposable element-derived protein domain-containing protein n=1 Tax=Ignelater luminosus TaxID=2038154 RepID=A0A8K0GII7_IGNLU|nr:hypothetical protein ILUMI_00322 [Ignelater luminosus]
MCDALNDLEASPSEKEHDAVSLPPASGKIDIHQIDSGKAEDEDSKVVNRERQKYRGKRLILTSDYHNAPSENDYCSTAEDMQAPIFSKTMSRDNFRTIKRYFHVADNQKLDNSKIAKMDIFMIWTCYDDRSDGHLVFLKWNDNAIVTVGSNHYGVTPFHKTARRVKGEHKKDVQQPNATKKYNDGMRGVDLLDRLCASYRPKLRSKKWW